MASRARGPVSSLGQTTSLSASTAESILPPPPLHASMVTSGKSVRSMHHPVVTLGVLHRPLPALSITWAAAIGDRSVHVPLEIGDPSVVQQAAQQCSVHSRTARRPKSRTYWFRTVTSGLSPAL